ncbi:MAG: hypothetical protein LBV54_08580 [Puniceicoccales bacterium]|jgi:hypothetical protein|nr:hypothetical protein [Puniceicoccales bacterium]
MTLPTSYIITGALLTLIGAALASGVSGVTAGLRAFPRSWLASAVFFGGGAAWFVMEIFQLGESDLAGFPRNWLVGIFVLTALLAFRFLSDLLAVRGLAVLMLLSARVLLDSGYAQLPRSLVLAGTAYILVVLGIWWGASPHVLRDWLVWALEKRPRALIAGALVGAVGVANLVSAFFANPVA